MDKKNERWTQIAEALFDQYVIENIAIDNLIVHNTVNPVFLGNLADQANCKKRQLEKAILISYQRTEGRTITNSLPEEKNVLVMSQIIKHTIKDTTVKLYDFRNQFEGLNTVLNRRVYHLNLNPGELIDFIYPLYLEAVEEIFKNK